MVIQPPRLDLFFFSFTFVLISIEVCICSRPVVSKSHTEFVSCSRVVDCCMYVFDVDVASPFSLVFIDLSISPMHTYCFNSCSRQLLVSITVLVPRVRHACLTKGGGCPTHNT